MFNLLGERNSLCDRINRREWLQVGSLGAMGLSLPQLLEAKATESVSVHPSGGKAKSCIVLFMLGGPSQLETWDPKPDAPVEIRGECAPAQTSVAGIHIGEWMPKVAERMDKICVLRGMATGDNAHSTSGYAMCTGKPHLPLGVEFAKPGAPNDWPNLGAVVKKLRGTSGMPAAFTLPEIAANDGNKTWPGQDAGWLGRAADPWLLDCDPSAENFEVPDLSLAKGISPMRLDQRRSLLQQLDSHLDGVEKAGEFDGHNVWQRQAYRLLRTPEARQAFDLSLERREVRDSYGRNRWGQSVLLARRLVESGVTLVQVNWTRIAGAPNNGHWDTHQKNSEALREHLLPRMEMAYCSLLDDLANRGLLEETLVVWVGEMGRTPKINRNGGRDHWGNVMSIALAGGGIRGGQVYGASDCIGSIPVSGKISPADLSATIFNCLGYHPSTEINDLKGRPQHISQGRVIQEIL